MNSSIPKLICTLTLCLCGGLANGQVSPSPSKPGQPSVELLEELPVEVEVPSVEVPKVEEPIVEVPEVEEPEVEVPEVEVPEVEVDEKRSPDESLPDEQPVVTDTPTCLDAASMRHQLLTNPNRCGYGGNATGGINEIRVSTLGQLSSAIQVSGNYIILDESLTGQTLKINTTLRSDANNLTIDGSCAPGVDFRVGGGLDSNRGLLWLTGDNIILHDFETSGTDYPGGGRNQGSIRIYGKDIWIDKITGSGFDDDFINIIGGADFITTSRLKTRSTHKSVFTFNTSNPNTRLTLHNSDLSSTQRSPWISAGRAHVFNNWIHDTGTHGTRSGRSASQANSNFRHNGIAEVITQHNVYENIGTQTLVTSTDAHVHEGYIESVNDQRSGGVTNGNITFSSTPSLFNIPYDCNALLLPADQVKAHVKEVAGASEVK